MSDPELAVLRNKLDDLSDRIGARIKEFETNGEFAFSHQALINDIQQRNDTLRNKVAEAARNQTLPELLKAETLRDFSSLFDDLMRSIERLDAETAKHHGS